MLGGKSEVRPSRSVHLCCVKQVHSVLISYGHQVLRHLGSHRKWDREREVMDKFQLPRGCSWRALCWEGNTVVIISNIHHATIVSRYHVCGILGSIIENTEICTHSAECFPPKQYERMCSGIDFSCKQRETAEISPHQRSAIRMSPRCLNKEERRRRLFCLSAWNREEYFPAFAPTHLTQGRKHGGLTSPGSCGKKQKEKRKKIRNKQWGKTSVWSVGTWDTSWTLNHGWDPIIQSIDVCEWQAKSRVILTDEKSWLSFVPFYTPHVDSY